MSKIIVSFPPDFDGQLDIEVSAEDRSFGYSFSYAAKPEETSWQVLLRAAKAIIEQESRRSSHEEKMRLWAPEAPKHRGGWR